MKVVCPAKLNLFFCLTGKRPDGYHEVASLYQAIDLADELTIELKEGSDELTTNDAYLPCDSTNLVLRAADLFRKETSYRFAVHAYLNKRIPVQAGLGGGSSNAAGTLRVLNQLTGSTLSLEDLKQLAAQLGSDVPFFLSSGSAFCTGRGDLIEEIAPLPLKRGWLAKPHFGLSTPAVYAQVNLAILQKRDLRKALSTWQNGGIEGFNDLEPAAFSLLPELAEFKQMLVDQGGFRSVTMTGSGTAFYCFGENEPNQLPGVVYWPFQFVNLNNHA